MRHVLRARAHLRRRARAWPVPLEPVEAGRERVLAALEARRLVCIEDVGPLKAEEVTACQRVTNVSGEHYHVALLR